MQYVRTDCKCKVRIYSTAVIFLCRYVAQQCSTRVQMYVVRTAQVIVLIVRTGEYRSRHISRCSTCVFTAVGRVEASVGTWMRYVAQQCSTRVQIYVVRTAQVILLIVRTGEYRSRHISRCSTCVFTAVGRVEASVGTWITQF